MASNPNAPVDRQFRPVSVVSIVLNNGNHQEHDETAGQPAVVTPSCLCYYVYTNKKYTNEAPKHIEALQWQAFIYLSQNSMPKTLNLSISIILYANDIIDVKVKTLVVWITRHISVMNEDLLISRILKQICSNTLCYTLLQNNIIDKSICNKLTNVLFFITYQHLKTI